MVMTLEQVEQLRSLLRNMDACARNIEQISVREQQAAHQFDAEALEQLSELRALSYQTLKEMEKQTRKLLGRCGAAPDITLSAFIDLHTPQGHEDLQALRRSLYTHMLNMHKSGDETRLHLKAAHEVSVGILQHIGAVEPKQTYARRDAT